MKFLCHSDDATYANKEWKYTLDQRIHNPTEMLLSKACFSVPTNYSNPPHVVYLRSHAFDSMIKRKHVVELKNTNHMGSSNVLAVLSETHTPPRTSERTNNERTPDEHNVSAPCTIGPSGKKHSSNIGSGSVLVFELLSPPSSVSHWSWSPLAITHLFPTSNAAVTPSAV